ncbi:MAG: diacylglycerol/lipid kinase family protein [Nocardioides sp.]
MSPTVTTGFCFLVNPSSGGGAAPEAVVPVARLLRDAGAAVEVTYSPGPHSAQGLVAAAVSRGEVVVSVGGDGMLSSVAGLVSRAGGTLGVLPAGRGNDFARMLDLPSTPAEQAELFLSGAVREVDLIAYEGRLVAGSVYAGVDARAAELVDRARLLPGSLQYPYAALRSLATYRPGRYLLSVDGDEREVAAATVVVANSAYYGKGMRIAPGAAVADGLLDVVVIEAASRLALMRALPSVYDGSHVGRPEVHLMTGSRVEIRGQARGPIPVGGDGEPLGTLPDLTEPPAVAEVRPGALRVLAP